MGKEGKVTGDRLHVKGTILGYKRGRRNSYCHTTLVKINDVNDKAASEFYFGKKIAYIFRAKTEKNGTNMRVIWGKVMRAHGTNGVVRAKFSRNIPSEAFGSSVRVMLYPSRV